MNEAYLPTGISFKGETVSFLSIYDQFSNSEYGQKLGKDVRYGPFKHPSVDKDVWEKTLGSDVNNLRHLPVTHQLTRSFLYHCANPPEAWNKPYSADAEFSQREQGLLLFAANTHDFGEAIGGDIITDLKTDQLEREEIEYFKIIFARLNLPIDPQLISEVIEDILDPDNKTKTKLGRAFNAIERGGYLRTGINAWEKARKTTDPNLTTSLLWVAQNVLSNQIPALLAYANTYPPNDLQLRSRGKSITDAFKQMPFPIFLLYDSPQKVQSNIDKFTRAHTLWFDSCYVK